MQSVGEFDFAVADELEVRIQARFVAAGANVSVLGAMATNANGYTIELRASGALLLDGAPFSLPEGHLLDLGRGARLSRESDVYYVTYPHTEGLPTVLSWQARGDSAAAGFYFTPGSATLTGLVGNANGNPQNDLAPRGGQPLPATSSPATIHGPYADSWRVTNLSSLFSYSPGPVHRDVHEPGLSGERDHGRRLPGGAADSGTAVCEQYGVGAGPQFDDCLLDVLATGKWTFAAMAAQLSRPMLAADDLTVDDNGRLSVDFEGTIPPNFDTLRLGRDPALTQFAGPFAGQEQYRFYVPALPGHASAVLEFDVITFGDWQADPGAEQLTLRVGDTPVWQSGGPSAWTPTAEGALASGQPYRRYSVRVPLDHAAPQLAAVLAATGSTLEGTRGSPSTTCGSASGSSPRRCSTSPCPGRSGSATDSPGLVRATWRPGGPRTSTGSRSRPGDGPSTST
jgi:hypothetical protein